MVRHLIFLALLPMAISSQTVPADSLLSRADVSFGQKLCITPIALFQRLSYATPGLHCQFEPSCSQFMAQAIANHGILKGLVIGTDRLIRCNPFAFQHHIKEHPDQFSVDGRILDPVPGTDDKIRLNKYTVCSIIPGLGRALAGCPGDGLVSFIIITTLAAATLRAYERDSVGGTAVFGSLTTLFWMADFYAVSRTKRSTGDVKNRQFDISNRRSNKKAPIN